MSAVSATLGFIQSRYLVSDTLAVGAFLRAVLTSLVTDQFEVQQSVCVCKRQRPQQWSHCYRFCFFATVTKRLANTPGTSKAACTLVN